MYIRIEFCGSLKAPTGEVAAALKDRLRAVLEAPAAEIDFSYDADDDARANPRISASLGDEAPRGAWERVAGWFPSSLHERPHDALGLGPVHALHDAIGATLDAAGLVAKKRPSMWPVDGGFAADNGVTVKWPPASAPFAQAPRGYW